ncbi:MFS transporter [Actinospica sp. MGRD01-02]|uniref:MFS transporter n=1 Tax=Actinospica acidithermotolerans TaxID=2828514 RepID=A0A941IH37_9ACTN|nr:MFS transporter [Actinospica acidithermotolerans]MBR7824788.1 MFS transporter [Actinospica acidithermotolerans]
MRVLRQLRTAIFGPGLRRFRLLLAVRLIGQFGDGAFQAALATYVVFSPQNAATPGKVAEAFAVLLLPFTVVGPFAGVFLDRWRRRQMLVWANVVRAGLVLGVAACAAAGSTGFLFYLAALAGFSANRFILAGLSAGLPHTVNRSQLVAANAVSPTLGTLATTVGAGVSVVVHAVVGHGQGSVSGVLVCTACLYALSALVALTMPADGLGPATPSRTAWRTALASVVHGVAAGAKHVVERPAARRPLAAIAVSRFCYGAVTIMTLLLFRNAFNDPKDTNAGLAGFAFAVGVSGVGFGLGALATPFVARKISLHRWIPLCLVSAGVAELVFGAPFREPTLLIGAFLLGFFSQGQKVSTDTLVQRNVDDDYRGRVFVFYDMLYNGSFVVAAAFAAATLPMDGRSFAVLGIVCGAYILAGVWYALRTPKESGPEPPAPIPAGEPTTPAIR